jgi:hypothetical protein
VWFFPPPPPGTSLTGNREPQPWYGFGGMVSV